MICFILIPFVFLFILSIHYSALSTLYNAFINQYLKKKKNLSGVFIFFSIVGLFYGTHSISHFLKISQQITIDYAHIDYVDYLLTYFSTIIFFSLSIACLKIIKDISRVNKGYSESKPIVLFLRKFKSKGDYMLPAILAGAVGDRFKIVALSSSYLNKAILFLIGGIGYISISKRICRPFSYVIDFCFTDDEEWQYTVESLVKKACYIIVDITNLSGNLLKEIGMILQNNREKNTLFTKLISKEGDIDRAIELLRGYNIYINENIIGYYRFFKQQETAETIRMMLIPRYSSN